LKAFRQKGRNSHRNERDPEVVHVSKDRNRLVTLGFQFGLSYKIGMSFLPTK